MMKDPHHETLTPVGRDDPDAFIDHLAPMLCASATAMLDEESKAAGDFAAIRSILSCGSVPP
jgi:hypothetical protein